MAKLVHSATVILMCLAVSASLGLAHNTGKEPSMAERPSNFDFTVDNPDITGNVPSPKPMGADEVTKCTQLLASKYRCVLRHVDFGDVTASIPGDCCRRVQAGEVELKGCFKIVFFRDLTFDGSLNKVVAHCKAQAVPQSSRKLRA